MNPHGSRRRMRTTVVLVATWVAVACGGSSSWRPGDPSWVGEFTDGAGAAVGRVEVHRSSTAYDTEYGLVVAGLTAGQTARWRLHEGKCDTARGIVGPAAEMPDLRADDSGRAVVRATVRMRMPENGDYSIRVTDAGGNPLMCTTLERVEPLGVYEREIRYQ